MLSCCSVVYADTTVHEKSMSPEHARKGKATLRRESNTSSARWSCSSQSSIGGANISKLRLQVCAFRYSFSNRPSIKFWYWGCWKPFCLPIVISIIDIYYFIHNLIAVFIQKSPCIGAKGPCCCLSPVWLLHCQFNCTIAYKKAWIGDCHWRHFHGLPFINNKLHVSSFWLILAKSVFFG